MTTWRDAMEWLRRIRTAPLGELGRWARLARTQVHLWRFCARRLYQVNVMAMSSALSFRTIFAMVPTLIVAFLVLKSMGFVDESKRLLRNFLEQSGIAQITYRIRPEGAAASPESPPAGGVPSPSPGAAVPVPPPVEGPGLPPAADPDLPPDEDAAERVTVAEKIEDVVERAEAQLTVGRLGPVGVVLLIWTALTLLTTMERSLNRIFEAPRSRSVARRVLIYWSVVTLGPLVLVATAQAAQRGADAVRDLPVLSWVVGPIMWVGPVMLGILLLAALYSLMPNTSVPFRVALEGALVAVPLWMLSKWGFALYVDHVGRTSLYGALGLVPLFLLWLNVSWLILLFGAQVAHAAANLGRLVRADGPGKGLLTPWHLLAAMLAVARRQYDGRGPAPLPALAEDLSLADDLLERVVQRLSDADLLCRVAGDGPPRYVLAVCPERLPVARVLRADGADGPEAAGAAPAGDAALAAAVAGVRRQAEAGVENLTLADIIGET